MEARGGGLARHGRGNPWTSGRAIGGRAQEGADVQSLDSRGAS
jgi:hypothetical protein